MINRDLLRDICLLVMRVLFVGINTVYSNPSKALMLPLLKGHLRLTFTALALFPQSNWKKEF